MCAYYEDKTTKIKKEDIATYQNKTIEIVSVKHIKSNKTMDIEYRLNDEIKKFNIPYHASIDKLVLTQRVAHA
jgi:uncharacterized membrane protein